MQDDLDDVLQIVSSLEATIESQNAQICNLELVKVSKDIHIAQLKSSLLDKERDFWVAMMAAELLMDQRDDARLACSAYYKGLVDLKEGLVGLKKRLEKEADKPGLFGNITRLAYGLKSFIVGKTPAQDRTLKRPHRSIEDNEHEVDRAHKH
ncbi:hypothetical protein Moror_14382 [Moniliophthora roreri MCA 2997]|uniref:Uncharacterized protein n=1 Tax=Moniliophthora roreri (strain MCA 2997) TaxID=1381753 RepID=V2WLR0_MONRO|nr:hypothetical protein Moror_14382 [Moniliophthora roreri MCA 2997]